jgi:sulfite exporter TauE/SafE
MAGGLLVAAFGVGTLPAMVLVSWLGGRLSLRARRAGEIIAGMILVAMAVQHMSRAVSALAG